METEIIEHDAAVARGYGGVAKLLHWMLFVLLTAQYTVGAAMPHISRNTPDEGLVAWHLSIGIAVGLFVVVKLFWRLAYPVPTLAGLPTWQRRLALAVHWGLYLLVIVMTALGWAGASYRGWDVKLFGIVPLPQLAAKGTPWAHTAGDIHNFLVYVLLGVIALHILGALYHHFIKRDGVLARMMPTSAGKAD